MCVKFGREMPGLDEVPFEGDPLGQRIYENVSKEAWKMWLEQDEDDHERVPSEPRDAGSAGFSAEADGRVLLRRRRRITAELRSAEDKKLDDGERLEHFEIQAGVSITQRLLHSGSRFGSRKDESQITCAIR